MKRPTVDVIGAGLSGLSAAAELAASGRFDIVVHERGLEPGGRRRAFFDAADGASVDSVNAMVWPHWRATRALIERIGAVAEWREGEREIAFVDMQTGERWTFRPGRGPWPWWALWASRRAPGLAARDYFRLCRLERDGPPPAEGFAAERLWRPLTMAAWTSSPGSGARSAFGDPRRSAESAERRTPLSLARSGPRFRCFRSSNICSAETSCFATNGPWRA